MTDSGSASADGHVMFMYVDIVAPTPAQGRDRSAKSIVTVASIVWW